MTKNMIKNYPEHFNKMTGNNFQTIKLLDVNVDFDQIRKYNNDMIIAVTNAHVADA